MVRENAHAWEIQLPRQPPHDLGCNFPQPALRGIIGEHDTEEDRKLPAPVLANFVTDTHHVCREASYKKNPTLVEIDLIDVIRAFGQLQKDRHRADYDLSWNIVGTDVTDAITLAEVGSISGERFESTTWRDLLSMFGANR